MIPPSRVLAGVDFSDPSCTALDFAARLARQCDAALHVSHIEDALLLAGARDSGFDLMGETDGELRQFVAATTGDDTAICHVGEGATADGLVGTAVDGLVAEAARVHADVIVVGGHGMSGAARLVFGSTTEGLLRHAPCPVLVVPDAWRPPSPASRDLAGMGPVICGIDLTLPAVAAAEAGARLAARLGTTTRLLHVVPQLNMLERWKPHAKNALHLQVRMIRRELEQATATFRGISPTNLDIEIGSVPETLAAWSTQQPHAMLVLGRVLRSTGSSPPGSNAQRVLTLAKIPVLMHVTPE